MKTVPYLYPGKEENTKLNNNKAKTNGEMPKELNDYRSKFSELINQNSPFRFMKIHTTLMEKEGIYRNDIAVIDPEEIPVTGKIVVVKLDDTIMIRRYEKIKGGILLHADGENISPLNIYHGYDKLDLLGVVAFIIKSYEPEPEQ